MKIKDLSRIANVLRRDCLISTTSAKSGHPTSCLSCAEIMSVLFFNKMKYDIDNTNNPFNDEFILSKGHAAPILYSCLFHAGCINEDLSKLREVNSNLEGHPMPKSLSWVKVASGSLGQGLSVGIGMALASKISKKNYKVYVLLGDSEIAEGSIYEAMQLAPYYKLNNLTAIVDVNRLGQRGETLVGHNLKIYKKRFKSFGWNVVTVDGHNIKKLLKSFKNNSKKPLMILAKTFKGKGVSLFENKENWHGKALDEKQLKKVLEKFSYVDFPKIKIEKPVGFSIKNSKLKTSKLINYSVGTEISTRRAYGDTLAYLAKVDEKILALDCEVSNSTYSNKVKEKTRGQFIECFIAEQNMIGVALGLSKKGYKPFASTFSAFLTRAHDQIRMSAFSNADFTLCGSHCGVSIGKDGASQMGLGDISMFRALPNSFVFYPSCANACKKITLLCSELKNLKYIRTTRANLPVIYNSNENFRVGDFKVLKKSGNDKFVLVGAGVTLHECLKAHEKLKKHSIQSAVIDLYCIKPFNYEKFISFVNAHGNKIVVVEDHYPQGGIGEMISSGIINEKIKMKHLAVNEIPHSGEKDELLALYKIDSESIVEAAGKW